MSNTRITEILSGKHAVGSRITVGGWIRTRRDSKAGLSFLAVHDGSCFEPLQVIAPADLPNYNTDIAKITTGCAVQATGVLVASEGKGQAVELRAESVTLVGLVEDPETYPMQPKRHTMEYLREVGHLRVRTNIIGAATRVRHCLAMAVHRFFHERGFFWIHTPIITGSDAEGAGQMFKVSTLDFANIPKTPDGKVDYSKDFFGRESHLTVSGQLNVETYCMAMSNVYTFGPTFRAENSNTRRHLAEFWMIEPEMAFADLAADAQLAEDFLKYIFNAVLTERADDVAFFEKFVDKTVTSRLQNLVSSKFARMDYTDAIKTLEDAVRSGKQFEFPVKWGIDLQAEHERFLTEEVIKGPVAVMNYPKDIKAFYMRNNDDGKTVAAMDVLAPGIGEIIGGSQREERLELLDARIDAMGLKKEDYWWYRDLRRYGTVPHAGFGLGFERAILYATGIENIRDVIPFHRSAGQASF
ncbi:MAG TPA: asparagine--tRNA ligase [Kofleriaceae bacterium]|jgi:asparaginyl-tRNA synthetase|nr:asparagine--tRNA ligase [Kofleriaceae bacterium]